MTFLCEMHSVIGEPVKSTLTAQVSVSHTAIKPGS